VAEPLEDCTMTSHKHLKSRVRDRMQRTGESYTTARRIVLTGRPQDDAPSSSADLAGLTPEAAALRVLLADAGVVAPHTQRPWTEAMLLGLTGGIGVAVFSFRYEADDVSTLFLGARRPDTADAMVAGLERLGIDHTVGETGGALAAERRLRDDLAAHGTVAAWVDAATLATRGMPASWQGGSYHVLAVLELDDDAGTARLADLAASAVVVDQATLAAARARIRKQRNRVLAVSGVQRPDVDLSVLTRDAIGACHTNLTGNRRRGFRIDALDDLATRMDGGGKDGWARTFPRGAHLWTALTSLHLFIEHHGTGGGLSRPLYARFLHEAAVATDDDLLAEAGEAYDGLGRSWTALAHAALPDDVDLLARARALHDMRSAHYATHGAAAAAELADLWRQSDELGEQAARAFPLDAEGTGALCAELARRTRALADAEHDAAALLARIAPR
jgi:Domain of unknown function (DUF4872)/Butirosin biosynthesis protein H, N-terminal